MKEKDVIAMLSSLVQSPGFELKVLRRVRSRMTRLAAVCAQTDGCKRMGKILARVARVIDGEIAHRLKKA